MPGRLAGADGEHHAHPINLVISLDDFNAAVDARVSLLLQRDTDRATARSRFGG